MVGSGRGTRTAALGRWGEDVAAQHLADCGLTVVARNWRCRAGELDVVAVEADGTVVFVEVKTRAGTGFGSPAEAVSRAKAQRIRGLAVQWLAENRPPGTTELRFDVVGIVRRAGAAPELTHLRSAF